MWLYKSFYTIESIKIYVYLLEQALHVINLLITCMFTTKLFYIVFLEEDQGRSEITDKLIVIQRVHSMQ